MYSFFIFKTRIAIIFNSCPIYTVHFDFSIEFHKLKSKWTMFMSSAFYSQEIFVLFESAILSRFKIQHHPGFFPTLFSNFANATDLSNTNSWTVNGWSSWAVYECSRVFWVLVPTWPLLLIDFPITKGQA